ncbi:hypothetical protein N8762_00475 [Candidatus Marinamargulisbacteria bacterium]|nr:hypothetical protein [bacterium]MDA7563947.1 hypothetical protein [Candidatus Marinamargulisbacteria bacterium]|tara:strand:+ start:6379 stop:7266 length:888 start_codon:yes stop_codon:yes gene_type:complete
MIRVCALLLIGLSVWGTDQAADYLRNQFSVRASGMSGASVAVPNDHRFVYNNPAAVIQGNTGISFSSFGKIETQYYALNYNKVFNQWGVNIGFRNAHLDGIVLTDASTSNQQDILANRTPHTVVGNSSWDSFVYHAATAYSTPWADVGISAHYIHENLVGYTGYATGVNAGLLSQYKKYTFGASVLNIGKSTMQWESGTVESIDPTYALGASTRILEDTLLITSEIQVQQDTNWILGAEFYLNSAIALRVGNSNENLSFGVGIALASYEISIAYQHESLLYNNDVFKLELSMLWD